jgi:hypothetical protein
MNKRSFHICQQPNLDGFRYCHSCIKNKISNKQHYQTQLIPATYDTLHQTLSLTIPENGKCNHRMVRGEFKGWYCSKPTHLDLAYCSHCITKITKFNHGPRDLDKYNNLVVCTNNNLCIRIL